jgi:hypothetical protein
MRRLTVMLGAGLLTTATVLTTAGAAAGSTTAGSSCAPGVIATDTGSPVGFFLGTPNKLSSGAAAELKPKLNSTTQWTFCEVPSITNGVLFENRGLALTSRASSPGADVTLEPPGNDGNGFASQEWVIISDGLDPGRGSALFNVKTGMYLRVRNGGPALDQTVTTGRTSFAGWTALPDGGPLAGHR